jgi:hypothetical protein
VKFMVRVTERPRSASAGSSWQDRQSAAAGPVWWQDRQSVMPSKVT